MTMASVNYLAILAAAAAAWLLGAVYYTVLSAPWMAAQGKTPEQCRAEMAAKAGTPAMYAPFILSFVAELVMAFVLSGVMGHVGAMTVRNGVISALFVWFGFVLTTMATNNAYVGRKPILTVIDSAHWLLVLITMGIVRGLFG